MKKLSCAPGQQKQLQRHTKFVVGETESMLSPCVGLFLAILKKENQE